MKVMVIPEDPTLDQYILKPIVERLFVTLGRTPRVQVLARPRLRGVAQALDSTILADVVETYPMVDLFLVMLDRDGDVLRRPLVAAEREREHPGQLLVCLAIEEIEVWMLAIHRDRIGRPWKEIRGAVNPKEQFAQPFLAQNAPDLDPGAGRVSAMRELGAHWKGVLAVCPELEALKQRIETWLAGRATPPAPV